jgi:hypothetical protein
VAVLKPPIGKRSPARLIDLFASAILSTPQCREMTGQKPLGSPLAEGANLDNGYTEVRLF